jgi:acyl carrier protein
MTSEEIKRAVERALLSVAPEADLTALDAGADLREELDIDSMDFLRFVTTLHDTLEVDVPEHDYPQIRTLDGCVAYLRSKLERSAGVSPSSA